MTVAEAQTELTALRAAMLLAITAGGVTAYGVNGRNVQRDLKWLSERERYLETTIAQGTGGNWFAGAFRNPE